MHRGVVGFFPFHSCYFQLPLRTVCCLPWAKTSTDVFVQSLRRQLALVPPHQGETKKQIREEESCLAAGCLGGWAQQAAGGKGIFLRLGTVIPCSGTGPCLATAPVPATPSTVPLLVLHGCQQSYWGEGSLGSPSLSCSP